MTLRTENSRLIIGLEGVIDSTNAQQIEDEALAAIETHPDCTPEIDASALTRITSAGLRMLLTLSRRAPDPMRISHVTPEVLEVLALTGMTSLLDVHREAREISVEGCSLIGEGAVGRVYRLDDDTIVKVFKAPDALPMIENEQKRARQAFMRGVPTAIPYDIVRVGDCYGSVFEMVQARNGHEILRDDPEARGRILKDYVQLLKILHDKEDASIRLPSVRDRYLGYLDAAAEFLAPETLEAIRRLLQAMPPDHHLVHGDIQMGNVMFTRREPLFIDMESLAAGDPVFDLASLFMAYIAFNEDDPEDTLHFFGIDAPTCARMYDEILTAYLGSEDAARRAAQEDRIRLLGYIRLLHECVTLGFGDQSLRALRVRHTAEHLSGLALRVDRLPLFS